MLFRKLTGCSCNWTPTLAARFSYRWKRRAPARWIGERWSRPRDRVKTARYYFSCSRCVGGAQVQNQKRENLFHAEIATARAPGQLSLSPSRWRCRRLSFFEPGRLAAAFFRGPDSMRTNPLFMPRRARSTLNLTAVTGRSCILPPGLTRLVSNLERVMGGREGGKGRLWALDSAFFWPADDWNSPRVIRTCLRLRFMEIGGWFTSGWVSNGIWGSYRVMWIIGTGVISGIVENLTIFHSW